MPTIHTVASHHAELILATKLGRKGKSSENQSLHPLGNHLNVASVIRQTFKLAWPSEVVQDWMRAILLYLEKHGRGAPKQYLSEAINIKTSSSGVIRHVKYLWLVCTAIPS